MTIIRLNESHRQFLCTLALNSITCEAEQKADAAAYAKAANEVRRIVIKKYPPKDMTLLARYEVAQSDACIKLQLTSGGVVQFNFRGDDKGPMRPSTYDCGRRIYAADETATPIISVSLQAQDALAKATSKKVSDYNALIRASTTLEQVEQVWPAAAALRERVGRALPVVLSADIIARIKADVSSAPRRAAPASQSA